MFQMLQALLRWFGGADRFATIQQLHEAVSSEPLIQLTAPPNGWRGREEFIRLGNHEVGLFYKEKYYGDGKHVETLDISAIARRGGVHVIYVNDNVHALTHNSIPKDVQTLAENEKWFLNQILVKVRQSEHS